MSAQSYPKKVEATIECTSDERAYIKILAAKAHLSLSDLILSYLREDFPSKKTLNTHKEAMAGKGVQCKNLDEFWKGMGIEPNAFD
jgi:hypothetical protein